MKQRVLTILLCMAMLVGMLSFSVQAADSAPECVWTDYTDGVANNFGGGSGTEEDPYQIATPEQLAKLAKDINSGVYGKGHGNEYFVLTKDLDLSAHRWEPIGSGTIETSFHSFGAYFDGQNHVISGMYVDESAEQFAAGLFGNVTGQTIKNIIIKDAYVKTTNGGQYIDGERYDGAGILVGNLSAGSGMTPVVENCHVSGVVENDTFTGGFVGYNSYATYTNCTADVTVKGTGKTGGFVGEDYQGTYSGCVAKGDVNGTWSVGGFAGVLWAGSTADKCIAYGKVTVNDWNIGGFVGWNEDIQVTNCIAYGDISTTATWQIIKTGGFAGTSGAESKFQNCYAVGKIISPEGGQGHAAGFAGYDAGGTTEGCFFDSTKNAALNAIGDTGTAGTNKITGLPTAELLVKICENYYGGHDAATEYTVDVKPTCTEKGSKSYHCTRCDALGTPEVVQELGHDYETAWKVDVDPTCTAKGSKSHHCTRCDAKSDVTEIDMIEHSGGKATCTAKAKCEACGNEYGEVDGKNHSSLGHVAAKAATTKVEGNIEYWYCKDCQKYYSDAEATKEIKLADTVISKLPADTSETTDKADEEKTVDGGKIALWVTVGCVGVGAIVVLAWFLLKKKGL